MTRRGYGEDLKWIERRSETKFEILRGFVPNMRVPGYFYVNAALEPMMFDELQASGEAGGVGGFLPAVKQIANGHTDPSAHTRVITLPPSSSPPPVSHILLSSLISFSSPLQSLRCRG